jgi:hypothetical protein
MLKQDHAYTIMHNEQEKFKQSISFMNACVCMCLCMCVDVLSIRHSIFFPKINSTCLEKMYSPISVDMIYKNELEILTKFEI